MRKLLVVLAGLLLTSCAYTKIDTQRLPAANTQQPFASLFVFSAGKQLGLVKEMEKALGEEFAAKGISVQMGTIHLPYDATPDAVYEKAAELPVEGLLIVAEEAMDVETSQTAGYWVAGTKDAPGYWVPAQTTQTFKGRFSAQLFSTRVKGKFEKVWLADIDSSASAYGGPREIFKDVGRKVVGKLAEDGMIVDNRAKK
jgi:hypothetical protein